MLILKHDDADSTYNGQGFDWVWAAQDVLFQQSEWQLPWPGQRIQLLHHDVVIWTKEGAQNTPDEVWNELTYALLMHDIICEPLTPTTCDVLELPSMDMT